jgi:hypothetical protein
MIRPIGPSMAYLDFRAMKMHWEAIWEANDMRWNYTLLPPEKFL